MSLPSQYQWVKSLLQPPRVLAEALKLYGIVETPGPVNTPAIMAWAKELNLPYQADAVPWCGLFAAYVVDRAGFNPVAGPLWARNWAQFGNKAIAGLGDVLVFKRDGGGHVGFYVAEDATHYHALGGNQGDKVSIVRIDKARCIAVRRCPWRESQPISVRPYHVAATGKISTNEG